VLLKKHSALDLHSLLLGQNQLERRDAPVRCLIAWVWLSSSITELRQTQQIGFFYCNRDLDAAPLEVSVHFRIISHNDPSSFNQGRDLLLPSGVPWQITLPQVACRATYTKIRDQLLEKNLVAAEELTQCLALFWDSERTYPALTLFRLEQEFPVEFSGEICLTAVGHALHPFTFSVFHLQTTASEYRYPWNGAPISHRYPAQPFLI
jgi:hypothetical protein